jgi:hypothetical protein
MMHGGEMMGGDAAQGSDTPKARLDAIQERQDALEGMLDQMLEHDDQMFQP